MIQADTIRQWAQAFLADGPGFVVDVRCKEGNMIKVFLDNDKSTSIEDCIALSRHLESQLDREVEDFQLDVSSPGLDQPLQMLRQYIKNIGRQVDVRCHDGRRLQGALVTADEKGIQVLTREKQRIEGRRAKAWVETHHDLPFSDIHSTYVVISFQ